MTRGRPRITIRMDQKQIDQLQELAEAQERSVSDIVRELIEQYLADQQ